MTTILPYAIWADFAFGVIALLASMPYFWKANKTRGEEAFGWSLTAGIYLAFSAASGLAFLFLVYLSWLVEAKDFGQQLEHPSSFFPGAVFTILIFAFFLYLVPLRRSRKEIKSKPSID